MIRGDERLPVAYLRTRPSGLCEQQESRFLSCVSMPQNGTPIVLEGKELLSQRSFVVCHCRFCFFTRLFLVKVGPAPTYRLVPTHGPRMQALPPCLGQRATPRPPPSRRVAVDPTRGIQ